MAINQITVDFNVVSKILKDTNKKDLQQLKKEAKEIVSTTKTVSEWDVKIDDTIYYFDSELSYELTGYKPINKTKGLDFNPEWFLEARRNKERIGRYCEAPFGTKIFNEFWDA